MLRKTNLIKFFVMICVLFFGLTQAGFGAVSNSRWQNEIYISETEGSSHAFSAMLYKVVDNANAQTNIEKVDVSSNIVPIYSSRKDAGTTFSTDDQAINTVKGKVYGDTQLKQIIANAQSYALNNKVKIIHISLLYGCKINGKNKEVLIYFNHKVSYDPHHLHAFATPQTSGYLIVDPNPVWVKISYTSRNLDSSVQSLATYNNIRNSLMSKGILGRLVIQEVNLNGTVVKTLVNTQVNNNNFEMPQSGSYIPEVYITRIINAYKNIIQQDTPLYILADYIGNPTVATDKNGNVKMTIRVLNKTIYGKVSGVGGYSCVSNYCLYVSPRGKVETVYKNTSCLRTKIVWGYCEYSNGYKYRCRKSVCAQWKTSVATTSSTTTNVYNGRFVRFNGYGRSSMSYRRYDEPLPCVMMEIGGNYVLGGCAQCSCRGHGPKLNIFKQRGNTFSNWGQGFQVNYGKIRYCGMQFYKYLHCTGGWNRDGDGWGGGGSGGGEDCYWETHWRTACGDWINLAPNVTATRFSTSYKISYAISGTFTRYLVSEPLTKIPLSGGGYYYAMQNVENGFINYKSNVNGIGTYKITKYHSIYVSNAKKSQLNSRFYYDIVDPFKTNNIIDVRHDTVNGLSSRDYPGWNTPITYVLQ